ncbi:MAG: hypothetical protein KGY76_05280 [Candidatus Thermoplasmatota archaeon]|nr:hypothetical protein [Candidatus Thermoplasmatota archaeon]
MEAIREGISRRKIKDEGMLSIIDALLFALVIMIVSFSIFQLFGSGLLKNTDVRESEFRRESVLDIQKASIESVITKSGYVNQSGSESRRTSYENITVETAIKNYLFISEEERKNEELSYRLNELKNDIKERYRICAWNISKYHFAVNADYGSSTFFISDIQDISSEEDLPPDRGASSTVTTLEMEPIYVRLYIWR